MKNIDVNEVEKFNALAADWWDNQGYCKPLHDINPLRLQFITQHCSLTNKKIVDIGCGGGILSESMAIHGGMVTGIDMSSAALDIAKAHAKSNAITIDYQQITAENLAETHAHTYDIVTCMELLEHVPDPDSLLTACKTLIKPNGHIFLSTINRTPKAYLLAIIGAEYILNMLPQGTHDYTKFIKPAELAHTLGLNELEIHDLRGIHYNILTKTYSLHQDVSVNYLVYCQSQCL